MPLSHTYFTKQKNGAELLHFCPDFREVNVKNNFYQSEIMTEVLPRLSFSAAAL